MITIGEEGGMLEEGDGGIRDDFLNANFHTCSVTWEVQISKNSL